MLFQEKGHIYVYYFSTVMELKRLLASADTQIMESMNVQGIHPIHQQEFCALVLLIIIIIIQFCMTDCPSQVLHALKGRFI